MRVTNPLAHGPLWAHGPPWDQLDIYIYIYKNINIYIYIYIFNSIQSPTRCSFHPLSPTHTVQREKSSTGIKADE